MIRISLLSGSNHLTGHLNVEVVDGSHGSTPTCTMYNVCPDVSQFTIYCLSLPRGLICVPSRMHTSVLLD